MTIQGKNILVTGGAGFIGSHIAKRLSELEKTTNPNLPKYKNNKTLITMFQYLSVQFSNTDNRACVAMTQKLLRKLTRE